MLDLIQKISIDRDQPHLISVIFLDTFYYSNETLDLSQRCIDTYNVHLKVYKPVGVDSTQGFEEEYGLRLWETDDDTYDYLVKVEPALSTFEELNVKSIITGHCRSQNEDRGEIPVLEINGTGLVKLNPLAYREFDQVWTYTRANEISYNALVDQNYSSIGNWHSIKKSLRSIKERSGKWFGKKKG